jgi:plastocyanin
MVQFDDAGDYPYYCSLHGTPTAGMDGRIRVADQ